MENDILVSVIIPTHNRKDYVGEAIQSVIGQTYKNLEIIVVDDNANNPEVRQFIQNLCLSHPQCTLIQNATNKGGALTRNEGIKVCKGELISFLDDDDTYEPTRIEEVVNLYKEHRNEKIGLIYTFCHSCDAQLAIVGRYEQRPTSNPLYRHMCGCLCATSQWVIPLCVFEDVGMFEDTPCKQDSIMLLKILGEGYGVLCVEKCLSNFRLHQSGRISGNFQTHLAGENNLLSWQRKYYSQLSSDQIHHVEGCTLRRIMLNHAGLGNRYEAFKLFLNILKQDRTCVNLQDFMSILLKPQGMKSLRDFRNRVRTLR